MKSFGFQMHQICNPQTYATTREPPWVVALLRRVPARFPGKLRVARIILGEYLDRVDVCLRDQFGYVYRVPSLREPIAFHLLVNGGYELRELEFAMKLLQEGSVFVDGGANIGTFSIPASGWVGNSGRVVAVEPSPKVTAYLEGNIRSNESSNISVAKCALSNSDHGSLPFYEAPPTHFGMGSLAAQFHSNPVTVGARTLDSVLHEMGISEVDVVKLDVEGFEEKVLRGAETLLRSKSPPVVVFEFCDWADRRATGGRAGGAQFLLKEWGFKVWRLSSRGLVETRPEGVLAGSATLVATKGERTALVESVN